MDKEFSSEALQPWEYYPQSDGMAVVILRKNIMQDVRDNQDGTSDEFWKADMLTTTTGLPEEAIEDNFDELWQQAVAESYRDARGKMTDAEWRDDIDSLLLDIMEAMVE